MTITWKDAITTLFALAIGVFYYARLKGITIPYLSSTRLAVLALAIIGIAMCAIGSQTTAISGAQSSPWITVSMVLAITSFVAIIVGLITGSSTILNILIVAILALYLTATTRHLLGK